MKKILVPTDFSDNALKASRYAAAMANKTGAVIFLLHVTVPVEDSLRQPFSMHDKYFKEVTEARMSELESVHRELKEVFPDVKIEMELARGSVPVTIAEFALRNKMDLIVMGTKGATGLIEIFMGSNTTGTIARTKVPVLAVPADYEWEQPDAMLFATNHFEKNTELLQPIMDMAVLFGAAVHIAVFVEEHDAEDYNDKSNQLQAYIKFLQESYPENNFTGQVLKGKDFEETIEKYDSANGVDIIAMVTYPKSIWEKLVNKSVTKKMALHTKVPVLALPAT